MEKKVIESYPAYDVVSKKNHFGVTILHEGDKLIQKDHLSKHKIGSVVGYSVENNDCPFEAVEQAKKNGHDLYYIFGLGSCISSHKQARKEYIEVSVGDDVYFQGRLFEVVSQPNQNLGLKDLGPTDRYKAGQKCDKDHTIYLDM